MLKGQVVFRYPDHEETFAAGDAYYGAPNHTPVPFAGTEATEFSPSVELEQTMAVIGQNLEAMKAMQG